MYLIFCLSFDIVSTKKLHRGSTNCRVVVSNCPILYIHKFILLRPHTVAISGVERHLISADQSSNSSVLSLPEESIKITVSSKGKKAA